MTGKIVEVIAIILDGLNKKIPMEEVTESINNNHQYDKQTVSAAFSLVFDKVLNDRSKRKIESDKKSSCRFLTEDEKEVIGVENYNYVLHLQNIGLMDSVDFELFVDQIMMYPNEILTKDDINWIILISLVDLEVDIMPGSRILLFSTDTIN
ncbi:MAG: DUF494 family protein [Melioribacteraceae bacterium]|nr:DUF494 family protein [Melioribacteraceae bacterium]MCF8264940.1 DUF494 family protein [Melioribacteraceae bacterium]MCF8413646.1 DUF494 family protein [Melioribacteraceae bacterium]